MIVITGAGGFVGRELVAQLLDAGRERVTCLVRRVERAPRQASRRAGWRVQVADLLDPAGYQRCLDAGSTVIHLAALTGKASARAFHRANVDGTRRLIDVARQARVGKLVLVSSIAVSFRDQRFYPYAASKQAAEHAVMESGIPWVIVRPTMVLGRESRIGHALRRLAGGPAGILFGRGSVKVQPVHVRDLATLLLAISEEPESTGEVIEVGGPDAVSFETLLRQVRIAVRGSGGPWVRLPLTAARLGLAAIEPLLRPVLPLSAGQLTSFANDGTPLAHPLVGLAPPQISLDAMIRELAQPESATERSDP